MAKLVLLVVTAAWAAVLIPPMLRSRVDNRPNSSVTDFRRQLNRLQSTSTPQRGAVRSMGRPLVQSSPLARQAAAGRPGARTGQHRQASLHAAGARGGTATRLRHDQTGDTPRYRTHGDPSGGQRRPQQRREAPRRTEHRDTRSAAARQRTHDRTGGSRRPAPTRTMDAATSVKRRRMNVLFVLVVTAASTMFLAATTQSTVLLWMFGISFLALCGYLYVLAQLRQREQVGAGDGWLERY